jgi:hypothetical protein
MEKSRLYLWLVELSVRILVTAWNVMPRHYLRWYQTFISEVRYVEPAISSAHKIQRRRDSYPVGLG